VGRSLRRENGSAVYNCFWSSPAQSFLDLSPVGLMSIFYCLRFKTSLTWRGRSSYLYPPGTGSPSYTPRHWVPFSSPPTTRRATVEASPRGVSSTKLLGDSGQPRKSYLRKVSIRVEIRIRDLPNKKQNLNLLYSIVTVAGWSFSTHGEVRNFDRKI
jgi:hypothetical protein